MHVKKVILPSRIVEDIVGQQYANGTHYTSSWLREHAVPAERGKNPLKKVVVDLNVGDSVEDITSTKGKKVWGPSSVEVLFWPDGGQDMRVHELGRAPEMPRTTFDGRFLPPESKVGRQKGHYVDKDTYEWDGKRLTVREWFDDPRRDPSVNYALLRLRIKNKGWTVQKALTTPNRNRNQAD